MNQLSIAKASPRVASAAAPAIHKLLDGPYMVLTLERAIDEESGVEYPDLDYYGGVSHGDLKKLLAAGWFTLEFSTDGFCHLWPDYSRWSKIPRKWHQLRDDANLGLVIDTEADTWSVH